MPKSHGAYLAGSLLKGNEYFYKFKRYVLISVLHPQDQSPAKWLKGRDFYPMYKRHIISILIICVAFLLSACAPKRRPAASAPSLTPKQKQVLSKLKQSGERTQKIKKDLKELFPEAGTCPIDSSKVDPDSDQGKLDMALELCKLSQDLWEGGDREGAIKVLDDALGLVLSVSNDDEDPDIEQQKDDLRFLIAKRILEIHTSRLRTTKGLNNAIPLTVNKYVKKELELFQGKNRAFFLAAYKRSGRYRPMIVRELKKAGLPEELSWLPLIESGFKIRALSRARALGLWQFIPSTGYKFGLKRNVWIDERLDPEKSTRAAIAYLTELHEIFGDWSTVLAAYNCGERTVLRAIDKQKINYLDNFWDLYLRLPRETARYVPKFLATLLIVKNPQKYGFELEDPDPPIPYETVVVKKQMKLSDIAAAIGVSPETMMNLNPSLRYGVTPDTSFTLRVPKRYGRVLLARLDEIKTWVPPKPTYKKRIRYARAKRYIRHRVRRGEHLSLLAKRYHTSVRAIKRANRLRSNRIMVGQVVKIPTGRTYVKRRHRKATRVKRYVVKRGDTLWEIARKFNVSVSALRRINRLGSNCLYIGQVLAIPSSG